MPDMPLVVEVGADVLACEAPVDEQAHRPAAVVGESLDAEDSEVDAVRTFPVVVDQLADLDFEIV
ncbi:hypothetical protein F8M49_06245 [Rhodococcus zopfii]|uniref:Uncharacterized protein n=1 Tax=Rhodococcus zopfii TaxID=43772 RepID=A0ABU3WMA1_9NOCA|nr:hypothetical protein [Rhodococcus zopfii]